MISRRCCSYLIPRKRIFTTFVVLCYLCYFLWLRKDEDEINFETLITSAECGEKNFVSVFKKKLNCWGPFSIRRWTRWTNGRNPNWYGTFNENLNHKPWKTAYCLMRTKCGLEPYSSGERGGGGVSNTTAQTAAPRMLLNFVSFFRIVQCLGSSFSLHRESDFASV